MDKRKRRQLFIKGTLQGRYLRLLVLAMFLPTVFIGGCLYYLILHIMAEEIVFPDAIASLLFPAIQKINIIILIGLPVLFFVILILGLFLSHRIAGPVFRLERDLEEIAEGHFDRRIAFRKKDEMRSVAEKVNRLLDKVQERLKT
jgi:signal transduction histidine kinase